MLIAQKTRESNIAEHVIYMFQIEDLIRAHNLDLNSIQTGILEPQISDPEMMQAYLDWYAGLIKSMKRDGVVESGHVNDIQEILMELLMLHNTMINVVRDQKYLEVFEKAMPILKDFQSKSNSAEINLVEVGFNALYAKIILKLQGKEISESSEQGFALISDLLGHLAAYYRKMKSGDLSFTSN